MKKTLLILSMALSGAMASNAAGDVVCDFESGDGGFGQSNGWGTELSIVDNPYKCGNESSKVMQLATSGWGGQGITNNTYDLSKKIVAIDVFSYSDAQIRCYVGALDKDRLASAKARVWNRLYFDFRSEGQDGLGSMIFTCGESATFFVDNLRFVDATDEGYDCDPMPTKADVDYKYGRLQIGGGGFVSGLLAASNGSQKVKLARTDVGGAYIWDNNACQWRQLFDFVSESNVGLLSIESFAVDPNNLNNMFFLCGNGYLSGQKTAVLYTKDGGKTFKEADLTSMPFYVHGNGDGRNAGERIAVDPNNGDVLFVGGRLGTPLLKSTDGAKTWSKVVSFPNVYTSSAKWPSWGSSTYPTTENQNGISCVVIDGSKKLANGNSARIFVGVSRTGSENIYMSEDGGESWTGIDAIPDNLMPVRMKLDPDGNLLMTVADKHWGAASGKIYRYNVETTQLEDITPAQNTAALGDVQVNPDDNNLMITSTNNTWVPQSWDTGKSANGDIFYITKDGGKNWTKLNIVLNSNGVTWVDGYAVHWCGSIAIDPWDSNKATFTSGNGIWSCNNIWNMERPVLYMDVNGVEETVPLDMVSVPGKNPMSVIGDYTGFSHESVNEYAPIHYPSPGTSDGIAYAALNTDIMARVSEAKYSSLNSYYTEDGGKTWKSIGVLKATKTALNADGSSLLIISGGSVKYSTDKGGSFSASSGAADATYVTADPVNPDYVYAAGKDKVYVSKDGGKSFTATALENNEYTRLCVVTGHEGLIYAPCGSKGLYVSKDKGATFSKVPGLEVCKAIGSGKGAADGKYALYAYADNGFYNGIFRSDDEGKTWLIINDDKHQFGGVGNGGFIVGDENLFGRFYMSSIGMGIVYGDLPANFQEPVYNCNTLYSSTSAEMHAADSSTLSATPNPFSSTFSLGTSGTLRVFNALGTLVLCRQYAAGEPVGQELPAGIYIVNINGQTAKVVKF